MPRILYVEDDVDVRSAYEQVLIAEGYEVDATQTIRGGEELLRRSTYDLLIADGRLPDGTGEVLADQAAKLDIPALIVTGYAFIMRQLTKDPERYKVLLKPIRPEELLVAIAQALDA